MTSKSSAMTETWIAEEQLIFVLPDGGHLQGRIALGLPSEARPGEYHCAVALDGLEATVKIIGATSLQALMLAVQFLSTKIQYFTSHGVEVLDEDDKLARPLDAYFPNQQLSPSQRSPPSRSRPARKRSARKVSKRK
jgi:hypothetical protein